MLVLFLDFTGYVMRWDADIHWMLVTGTNLLKSIPRLGLSLYRFVVGGEVPGTPTLTRFYAWHVYGLMLGLVFFGVWHIFRVRRDGGIAAPPPQERESQARISRGELVRREILAVLVASFCLVALASFFPAPIAAPMDTPQPENAAVHAPWFFLWVQYLLRFGDPFLMGVLIPLTILTILGLLPFLLPAPTPEELGRWWPKGGRAAQITAGMLAAGIVLLTLLQAVRFKRADETTPYYFPAYCLVGLAACQLWAGVCLAQFASDPGFLNSQPDRRRRILPQLPRRPAGDQRFASGGCLWLCDLPWWRTPGAGCRPGTQYLDRRR